MAGTKAPLEGIGKNAFDLEKLKDLAEKDNLTPDERFVLIAQRIADHARTQLDRLEASSPQKGKDQKYALRVDQIALPTLQDELRLEFFRTIKRKNVEIVSSLAQDILPRYKALTGRYNSYPIIWGHLRLPHKDKEYQEACLSFAHDLLSWASNHHLAWIQKTLLSVVVPLLMNSA